MPRQACPIENRDGRQDVDEETRRAFDEFARARMQQLLRFGHVLTGNPHTAADLVQDALERAMLAWPRVSRQSDPEGYVRRIMVNRNISVWRKLRRERLTAEFPEQPAAPPPGRDLALWNQLAELPPRQRAVIVLRYYEDMTEQETADVLGCSVGTVKSQSAKAIAKLRTRTAGFTEDESHGRGRLGEA